MFGYHLKSSSSYQRMSPRNLVTEIPPAEDELHPGELNIEPVITEETHTQKRPPMKIVWRNVILMTVLHLSALYSLTLLPLAHCYTLIWSLCVYMYAGIGITAGSHRLWAHRAYKAKLPMRALLASMQSAAFQNDIYDWSRDHRVHHKYSETDADPHNAKRGFFFSHVGWLLVRKHPDVTAKGKLLDTNDLLNDPVVHFQRKYYALSVVIFCFAIPTLVPYIFWNENLWNAYFLAGVLRYCCGLNATWLVNSAAHMWGYRPYDKRINPAENICVSLGSMGEGFHNYHHTFPQDYATSEYGWRINLTTFFIDFMAFLGQAYDRKTIDRDTIRRRRDRTGSHT
ncbi:stearoyl-CoA desaturase 5 isoform X1 [Octopus bimaculoides]|uniref:stearoyl-CoA desaturase 5 isoform X1 n=2 Tax=Octopus bimaculoides TaxID=37653 RepID=UPI0022E1489F|nr:stearoyl-CoA desaturase 5 isoform X1 [Octopus bimaculoides]XP_052825705.1 stearoyl-CoA desaturase 5 isoform X1 [Octopus bimaculoides]XP_052825706.1 stearoyl-CoA desaturase 5 isoform X1 [Octopus bimaculoides]